MVPEAVGELTASEQLVLDALREPLPDGAVVLPQTHDVAGPSGQLPGLPTGHLPLDGHRVGCAAAGGGTRVLRSRVPGGDAPAGGGPRLLGALRRDRGGRGTGLRGELVGPLLLSLRDPERGRVTVFSDEGQRVFNRVPGTGGAFVTATLGENLRNTVPIAGASSPYAPEPAVPCGGTGAPVRYVSYARQDAIERADAEVERLLEQGWAPEHVALLTTRSRYPEQVSRVQHLGKCRVLGVVLGHRGRLLRPRAGHQGARAAGSGARGERVPEAGAGARAVRYVGFPAPRF